MRLTGPDMQAAGEIPRRLCFYNAGFLRQPRLRRILALAGHDLRLGRLGPGDGVVVWGRSPYAHRGEAVAARTGAPLIRLEDAFLRSVRPGRLGDAPLGLLIDPCGVHFDSSRPSLIERILTQHPLDDSNLLMRARDGIERIAALDLSKYNMHRADAPLPAPGYVLVIDQTQGDASIRHAGASAARFREMLYVAQEENPTARIVIKTHPETALGLRPGHFGPADATGRISLLTDAVSPWRLLQGAIAVYAVSSQLGFEAILAGHRPRLFGQPFYAGWGLSADEFPIDRRQRRLTKAQLFAAAMILAPTWYDPCRDRLCQFEEAVDQLEAEVRAFRQDRAGHVAHGMRLWKRGRLQAVFGQEKPLIFQDNPEKAVETARKTGRSLLIWAGKEPAILPPDLPVFRVEDGFLRSRGLGAELVPPLSLCTDDLGIYYDPSRPSRLEALIQTALPAAARARAERLQAQLIAARLSKYNLSAVALPDLPPGQRILIPGQVEDDASIRLGAGAVNTNLGLLQAARAAHPEAVLIYKPHPDVEAGLRPGAIAPERLAGLADVVADRADPIHLIDVCDQVITMTSLLGFEALLRGKPVTCLGAPFYAGWGLTTDLGPVPPRRRYAADGHALPRPDLAALVHAALIAYPRYFDPVSRRPCPPEVVVDCLATGQHAATGLPLRLLAKLQGRFATYARFWR
jgi:capsular polysaccharide export protein